MVVDPAATPVTENGAEVAPAAMLTLAGRLTMPDGLLEKMMPKPVGGAGVVSVTVPFTDRLSPTV
jgi:hypothetical protein